MPEAIQTDLSQYTVLIVDDVPINLLLVGKMLARFNFKTVTAKNGVEALEAVREHNPALLVLDLMMPVMDGFEVIRRLRAEPETAGIRIIVLSALNSNEDIVRAYDLGANDFITKPVILEKLVNSVAAQFGIPEQ